jgi:hypothetical protein
MLWYRGLHDGGTLGPDRGPDMARGTHSLALAPALLLQAVLGGTSFHAYHRVWVAWVASWAFQRILDHAIRLRLKKFMAKRVHERSKSVVHKGRPAARRGGPTAARDPRQRAADHG